MELEGWKMIDNISDCVKNIFLYFKASGNLVWICVWIISWRYDTSMINIYRSLYCCDISQSEWVIKAQFTKTNICMLFNFMCSYVLTWETKWTHAGLRFQTSVKASSVHMKFHFGCISKRHDILMVMCRHFISGSVYMIF